MSASKLQQMYVRSLEDGARRAAALAALPDGQWAADPELQQQGLMLYENLLEGFSQWTSRASKRWVQPGRNHQQIEAWFAGEAPPLERSNDLAAIAQMIRSRHWGHPTPARLQASLRTLARLAGLPGGV